MSKEWETPVSKDKIISRRNRLIEYQKTNQVRYTPLYEIIDENILDINYMIYEIDKLNKQVKDLKDYSLNLEMKNGKLEFEIWKISKKYVEETGNNLFGGEIDVKD